MPLSPAIETDAAIIVTIPCRTDNYAYLLHDRATGATACIDVPEAAPINAELAARGWRLSDVLITHHHGDHVEGLPDLAGAAEATIWGAAADAHRLPPLTQALSPGDPVQVGSLMGSVIDVSGHTVGHVAYSFPTEKVVFTADSLMALGCGRLFEGTAEQMWASLSRLAALPDDTVVCSGHEYTAANARFALTVEPENAALRARADAVEAARAAGLPTVPSTLAEEHATNPFLRAALPEVKRSLNMLGADDAAVFAELRRRKDAF